MTTTEIFNNLPYGPPFLFVDELYYVNEKGASGCFTFHENFDFYKGHFKNYPITPGVILIETLGQIGGTSVGIYLRNHQNTGTESARYFATHSSVDFLKPVFPNEKVTVVSEVIYYRLGKLKFKAEMKNEKDEIVCAGILSGIHKKI